MTGWGSASSIELPLTTQSITGFSVSVVTNLLFLLSSDTLIFPGINLPLCECVLTHLTKSNFFFNLAKYYEQSSCSI